MITKGVLHSCARALERNPADIAGATAHLLRGLVNNRSADGSTSRPKSVVLGNRLETAGDGASKNNLPFEACAIGLAAWSDRQLLRCLALSNSQKCRSVFLDVLLLHQESMGLTHPHHIAALAQRHVAPSRRATHGVLSTEGVPTSVLYARECVLSGEHATLEGDAITELGGGLYSCTYLLGLLRDPQRWNVDSAVDIYRRVTIVSPGWARPRTAVDVAGGIEYGAANLGAVGSKYQVRLVPYVLNRDWTDGDLAALSTLLADDD